MWQSCNRRTATRSTTAGLSSTLPSIPPTPSLPRSAMRTMCGLPMSSRPCRPGAAFCRLCRPVGLAPDRRCV
eukprot:scaffold68_cov128-Isochrysis_galbana.AAC.3